MYLPDRRYRYVWEYLAELPGVNAPTEDTPAWEYVDPDEADATDAPTEEADA